MTDRNLDHLHPLLKPIAIACLAEYASLYPDRKPAEITVTWRSPEEQQKAYDAGLSNAMPGQSKHEFTIDGLPASKAFDYAVFDESGNYIADGEDDWYLDFAVIAKDKKLKWGGDWNKPDWDHCELED